MKLKKSNFVLFFLSLIGLASFINTIKKALLNGLDFQWYPAKLMWSGINHYQHRIYGNIEYTSQIGEYAHGLFVILFPFTFVDFEIAKNYWLLINVLLVLIIPYLISKNYDLNKKQILLVTIIFITAYPTRMALQWGQQSVFTFFFFILPFLFKSNLSYFFSGFSYFKYSLGYILAFNFLVLKKYKQFLLTIIPSLIGWLVYSYVTNSNILECLFDPIRLITKTGFAMTGQGQLFGIINEFIIFDNKILSMLIKIIIVFSLSLLVLVYINKLKDDEIKFPLIAFCPLIFTPHAQYDYIFLIPLLIYSIKNFSKNFSKINITFIIYYYYINRLVKHLINDDMIYSFFIFSIFVFILMLNLNKNLPKKNSL